MKTYLFPITLQGTGENEEQAWENAIDAFYDDPGCIPEHYILKEDDEQ